MSSAAVVIVIKQVKVTPRCSLLEVSKTKYHVSKNTFTAEKAKKNLNYICIYIQLSHRAREIDKCKSVQPFHKQSAISVNFTETTDRPFPRSWKLPIGSFRNDRPFPNIR